MGAEKGSRKGHRDAPGDRFRLLPRAERQSQAGDLPDRSRYGRQTTTLLALRLHVESHSAPAANRPDRRPSQVSGGIPRHLPDNRLRHRAELPPRNRRHVHRQIHRGAPSALEAGARDLQPAQCGPDRRGAARHSDRQPTLLLRVDVRPEASSAQADAHRATAAHQGDLRLPEFRKAERPRPGHAHLQPARAVRCAGDRRIAEHRIPRRGQHASQRRRLGIQRRSLEGGVGRRAAKQHRRQDDPHRTSTTDARANARRPSVTRTT